ncbi:4-hydroxybenzoate polyprenyl transferase [Mycena sanguinolenta]|uniref:4-hydroxybenzoate polyprenyl transferase n=1 Tax=Mycena sanguinolenta TaxID=230812 RepID=A0A8H6Z0G6_9AGAR|nr:4-hydroxybenzoate polyprenyl transferase [Mycena sanguinolenta]
MLANSHVSFSRPWIELARIHKPAGALLIVWPFVWGLVMASRIKGSSLLLFARYLIAGCIWFFVLRSTGLNICAKSSLGAGCIWNDIVDRDLDKQVERTRHRPLADGRISVLGALIFLATHLILLCVSWLPTRNRQLLFLVFATIFPLAGGYPFIKRISYWPQAWLGIAFNSGTLISWSWVTGNVSYSSVALACAGWFWTMWYDTIYSNQDKKDDIRIGIGSTALLFSTTTASKLFLAWNGAMFLVCLTVAGSLDEVYVPYGPYYLISVGGCGICLGKQLWYVDLESPDSCSAAFNDNAFVVGPIVALGMTSEYLLRDLGIARIW